MIHALGSSMGTDDIHASVVGMKARGLAFQDTIETCFAPADRQFRCHGENLHELRRVRILIEGATVQDPPGEPLLQVFTNSVIGPIDFEIVHREGRQGSGEESLRILFEGIELDQNRHGALRDTNSARASL